MTKVKARAGNIKSENPRGNKKPPVKKPKKITESYLHNAGLYYLQRFAASTGQFRSIMIRKIRKSCRAHESQNYEDCAEMLERVIESFTRSGLLNDELYTRGQVHSMRRRGKSGKAITTKLVQKGIAGDMIKAGIMPDDGVDAELNAALIAARKKKIGPFAHQSVTADETASDEKALATLARAGFSYDTAQRVLRMKLEDAEDILNGEI